MALKLDEPNANYNIGFKIEGDLGDLEVIEESDSEDDKSSQTQKVLRTFNNKPCIPPNLIQNHVPVFEKVTVENSEHVQFGNNTYFNGPVTIKQVIKNKSGIDNSSYVQDKDDVCDHHRPQDEKNIETRKKIPILLWHKITFSTICISIIGSIIAIVLLIPYKSDQHDSQRDFETFASANTTVVGYCIQNFQPLIMSMIIFFLTLILYFSLLTKESIGKCTVCVKGNKKKASKYDVSKYAEDDPLLTSSHNVRIVSRSDWLAQPPTGALTTLKVPAPWVIIAHTATESCFIQSQCVYRVRLIQMFHIESQGWFDIGYNFLVGGDGSVYYGRGWDYEGAHTKFYNKYSIGIAFIGTFNTEVPNAKQVDACRKLINLGVHLGKLRKDYKLFAHRQLMSTLSPGDRVYNIIRKWPNFVHNVTDLDALIHNS